MASDLSRRKFLTQAWRSLHLSDVAEAVGEGFADIRRRDRLFARISRFREGENFVRFLKENDVDIRFRETVSLASRAQEAALVRAAAIFSAKNGKSLSITIRDDISDTAAITRLYHEGQHARQHMLGLMKDRPGSLSVTKMVSRPDSLFLSFVEEADATVVQVDMTVRYMMATRDRDVWQSLDTNTGLIRAANKYVEIFTDSQEPDLAIRAAYARRAAFDEWFDDRESREVYVLQEAGYEPPPPKHQVDSQKAVAFAQSIGALSPGPNYLTLPGFRSLDDPFYHPTAEELETLKKAKDLTRGRPAPDVRGQRKPAVV